MALLGPLQVSLQVLGRPECSSGELTGEESASKLIHFIGRIYFFMIVWFAVACFLKVRNTEKYSRISLLTRQSLI